MTVALTVLFLAACDRGDVRLLQPETSTTASKSLTLHAQLAPDVSDADFGWPGGVPEADILLLRVRDFEPIERVDGATGAEGVTRFDGLKGGLVWVTLFRRLSDAEAKSLGTEWPVAALAGGGKVSVSAETDTTLVLRPPLAGTLVISEVALGSLEVPGLPEGRPYSYLELFNNATTTMWLDGMLLGNVYDGWRDTSRFGHGACADSEPMRVDPDGLWASRFWQFPGDGGDYPVAPGETVLIAVSATDHRGVEPTLPDLTGADFEFRPPALALADNPSAPDLEDVGPEPFFTSFFLLTRSAWFLAAPTDLGSLLRMHDPSAGTSPGSLFEWVRIPRDRIVDVAHIWWDNAGQYTEAGGSLLCLDSVNPAFDAVPGGFDPGTTWELTAQRRAVRARDGRIVLLDTNVSAIDFVYARRTPGAVPGVEW